MLSLCMYVRVILTLASVGSSMLSWRATSNVLVKTASACTFLFGPYAAYQQRKLASLGTLRAAQNDLRAQVNYLYAENERLQRSLGRLDVSVDQLESVERELTRISGGNQNLDRLVQISQEQAEINRRIKVQLKKAVLQNILRVVVKCDVDKDFMVNPQEMEILIVRLGMMDGVEFHERNFRRKFSGNLSLATIMTLIRSLLQNDNAIFTLCPEEVTTR